MTPNPKVLTPMQLRFLDVLGADTRLTDTFYLTGGTALAGFYTPYRLSEDLDFFSEIEFNPEVTTTFLTKNKKLIGYADFEYNASFNRNLYFLTFPSESDKLKIEFTYFPFSPYENQKSYKNIKIDSAYDIALNKLFSIYQNPTRCRDFIDLYMLCKTYHYVISDLMLKSASKFEWQIDPIKLGTSFTNAVKLPERPNFLQKVKDADWLNFYDQNINLLKNKVIQSV